MRIYPADSEEALRARKFLKESAAEGLLTEAQYEHLQQETVSELRTTNMFLRLVLFLFTLVGVAAAAALFHVMFLPHASEETTGILCLIFAAGCYAAAEIAVSEGLQYRHGIEEALLVCSVGFLFAGGHMVGGSSVEEPHAIGFLIPATCAAYSLWIWLRFGFWYTVPAAMIFVALLPGYWTLSFIAYHLTVAAFYTVGLICVAAIRPRYRFEFLKNDYSLAEAFLWLGLYLAINLKISASSILLYYGGPHRIEASSPFMGTFYWITWILIWCLPMVVIARGIRRKDRFVLQAGALTALLTLVSNKPYLGWQRHTWDPMLLGIFLAGTALFLRRWLAQGPGAVRNGFTAARLSERDKRWINAGSALAGFVSPSSVTPDPQTSSDGFQFGGGSSGGGGASGDF